MTTTTMIYQNAPCWLEQRAGDTSARKDILAASLFCLKKILQIYMLRAFLFTPLPQLC